MIHTKEMEAIGDVDWKWGRHIMQQSVIPALGGIVALGDSSLPSKSALLGCVLYAI
jgi:hypothetical protein